MDDICFYMNAFSLSQNTIQYEKLILTPARIIALICKHMNVSKQDFFSIITEDTRNRPPSISLSNSVIQNYRVYLLAYLLIEMNLMTDNKSTTLNHIIYNRLMEKYIKQRTLTDQLQRNTIDRENQSIKNIGNMQLQKHNMPYDNISTAFRLYYKGNYTRLVKDYENLSNFQYREIIIDSVFLTLPYNNQILYDVNSRMTKEVSFIYTKKNLSPIIK